MINLGSYSGKKLPNTNLRVAPALADRILEGVALLFCILIIVSMVFVGIVASGDLQAKAWFVGVTGIACLVLVGYCAYASIRWYNFPFKITEQNLWRQFRLAARLTRVLNVALGAMFLCYVWLGGESLLGLRGGVFEIGVIVAGGALTAILLGYYFLAYRYR